MTSSSNVGAPGTAERIAVRLLEALDEPFVLDNHQFTVSASIGVAQSSDATPSAEALLTDADAAMYRAKTTARGGYATVERPTAANRAPPDPHPSQEPCP